MTPKIALFALMVIMQTASFNEHSLEQYIAQPATQTSSSAKKISFTNTYNKTLTAYHFSFDCEGFSGFSDATLYYPAEDGISPGAKGTIDIIPDGGCMGGIDAVIFSDGTSSGSKVEIERIVRRRQLFQVEVKILEAEISPSPREWKPQTSLAHRQEIKVASFRKSGRGFEDADTQVLIQNNIRQRLMRIQALESEDQSVEAQNHIQFLQVLKNWEETLNGTEFPDRVTRRADKKSFESKKKP